MTAASTTIRSSDESQRSLVLGTAGHIDHGKTALIHALTGVDTDRLPQEQKRGISIDIGFAELDLGDVKMGVVDVPGHERFIRNMLAGASGIDLAMLVVAADDSVMPQTREHLAILELLGVQRGVIAITKSDLATNEWLDLVEQDIRDLVQGRPFAGAPIIRTSVRDGQGLDDLQRTLLAIAGKITRPSGQLPFRMAIDRSFVAQGVGTVVTGTVRSGSVTVNEEVEVRPAGGAARVRSIQVHGRDVGRAGTGQRTALNLGGIHHSQVGRGYEIAVPGYLRPSTVLTARIRLLDDAETSIKHRARVRLHIGTSEVLATVSAFNDTPIEPGESAIVQFILSQPVCATNGQPYVIRRESPLATLGGGVVLQPVARPIRRRDEEKQQRVALLESHSHGPRLDAFLWFTGLRRPDDFDLARECRVTAEELPNALDALRASGRLIDLSLADGSTVPVHRDVVSAASDRILQEVRTLHERSPLDVWLRRQDVVAAVAWLGDEGLITAVVNRLIADGVLHADGVLLRDAKFEPRLTERQTRLVKAILQMFHDAGFSPPDAETLAGSLDETTATIRMLIEHCVSTGQLIHIGDGIHLSDEMEGELRSIVAKAAATSGLAVSEIRDLLGTSRRFAVPFCEYLDRVGVTTRVGDVRVLSSSQVR